MGKYILKRFIYMIVLLAIMSVFAFVVIQLPPGDYLTSYIANLQQQMGNVDESVVESLRRQYGMVLQDTWLKTASVRENIRLAKPEATNAEIEAAARMAHADSFIRRLPEGYDTVLSDTGGALSAGQRQLLCIARVMLRLPPMLILDEATSSIDTRTEAHIQQAFDTMMQARTSFVVAHRLSTIREADVILVMKDGHIIEQGRHEDLLAQNGFYANLYHSQFEG